MRESREAKFKQQQYQSLIETPFLHSSQYLKDLYASGNEEEKGIVMDHINRFGAYEVDSYMELHNKEMERKWKV